MVGTQRLKLAGHKGGGLDTKNFEPSKHKFSVRKESREKGFYKASIDGSSNIKESVLSHLEGYRGSSPVRIGNAAVNQFQMDAYGYMLDALYYSSRHGSNVSEDMYYRFVKPLARYICENWRKPGNGIWEIREWKDHYVYTQAWCYAGLERAVKIAKITRHSEDTAP